MNPGNSHQMDSPLPPTHPTLDFGIHHLSPRDSSSCGVFFWSPYGPITGFAGFCPRSGSCRGCSWRRFFSGPSASQSQATPLALRSCVLKWSQVMPHIDGVKYAKKISIDAEVRVSMSGVFTGRPNRVLKLLCYRVRQVSISNLSLGNG